MVAHLLSLLDIPGDSVSGSLVLRATYSLVHKHVRQPRACNISSKKTQSVGHKSHISIGVKNATKVSVSAVTHKRETGCCWPYNSDHAGCVHDRRKQA